MEEATHKDPMKVSMNMVRGSSNKLKLLKLYGESLFPLVMTMTMQRIRSLLAINI